MLKQQWLALSLRAKAPSKRPRRAKTQYQHFTNHSPLVIPVPAHVVCPASVTIKQQVIVEAAKIVRDLSHQTLQPARPPGTYMGSCCIPIVQTWVCYPTDLSRHGPLAAKDRERLGVPDE